LGCTGVELRWPKHPDTPNFQDCWACFGWHRRHNSPQLSRLLGVLWMAQTSQQPTTFKIVGRALDGTDVTTAHNFQDCWACFGWHRRHNSPQLHDCWAFGCANHCSDLKHISTPARKQSDSFLRPFQKLSRGDNEGHHSHAKMRAWNQRELIVVRAQRTFLFLHLE
jgi:hypothetical protein